MKTYLAHVDVLMAVGYYGGVENVINRLGCYLIDHGFRFRIVQIIYEGDAWADSKLEFLYAYDSGKNMDLEKMCMGYQKILKETNEIPDVILATGWPYMSYVAKHAAEDLKARIPVIGYPHTNPWRYGQSGYGDVDMFNNAEVCFAISNQIHEEIKKSNPNCINYRVNNPLPEGILPGDPQRRNPLHIAYVGRFTEEKRPEIIVRALGECKAPFELFMAGSGKLEKDLKILAKNLKVIDRIHFLGWQDDPWKAIESSSFLIMSSIYEGFSLAATESMARGMGLISTPVSGSIELIKPGETGYLFEDYKELASILDKIAEGELPYSDYEKCFSVAYPYRSNIALFDLSLKLYATSHYKMLPYEGVRIIRVSVIVPEKYATGEVIESILFQSIGREFIELIIITGDKKSPSFKTASDYESKYPDSILIINLDTNVGMQEQINIGRSYSSGDYVYFKEDNNALPFNFLFEKAIHAVTYRKTEL